MNSKMWSRRVVTQVVAGAFLLVLGLSSLVVLAADAPDAGASVAAKPKPKASADSRTPYGEMNLAWTEPGIIGVVGWTKDPDVNRPIDVVVAIDRGLYVRTAGVFNPYLPGKYAEKFRSYLVAIPVTPGPHTMCVAALNVGPGNPFRLLGCKVFDNVVSADPVGNLEGVTLQAPGDRFQVSGWALDRDTTGPLAVDFTLDGASAGRTSAGIGRSDVGAMFPASGAAHGFSDQVVVAPGPHTICAVARNTGRGGDVLLGCRSVVAPLINPIGVVETVASGINKIDVSGWAGDPDAGTPITVAATARLIGGVDDPTRVGVTANGNRPDVAAVVRLDPRAGYAVSIPVAAAGTYEVCVTAYNIGLGADQSLGCRNVGVADYRPVGVVDSVTPSGSGVAVTGWTFDPGASGSVAVHIAVDGAVTTVTANVSRPDVGAAYPGVGNNRGFQTTISGLSAGRHTVCVTMADVQGGPNGLNGDRPQSCGAVVIGPIALGTSGVGGQPTPVGPGGGALADIDRDAGVSARLRDGSVLWLFGDSTALNADGSLRYFVGGTGAWAPANAPAVTRDAVTASGTPYLLATPGAGYPACPANRPSRVMWPLSATAVPNGPTSDRVIVYMANMCLGSMIDYEFMGVSVAHWIYDPATRPPDQPIQLAILNQNLAVPSPNGGPFGASAVYDTATGNLLVYSCGKPANPLDLANYGPCRVGRVNPASVGDPGAYTYWAGGSSWVSNSGSAQPMDMPVGAMSVTRYPAAAFSVVFDPAHNAYVMVYSPWPGFVDRAMVRVARTPQGPWTPPVEVAFEGCSNTVGGQAKACYAATAQPAFSSGTHLGIGYYDQSVPGDRRRGQYMVVWVPFNVAP